MRKNSDFTKFLRFAVTGGINTLVDFLVYSVVLYYGMGLYLAQIAGYSVGTLNSYCINRKWTFQSGNHFFGSELFKFIAANLLTLLLSLAILPMLSTAFPQEILVKGHNIAPNLIKIPLVAFTLCANFILSRVWVFR